MVYWVDNPTAVAVKPKKDLVHSAVAKWFNDQLGVTPTIPRAEWFNMIQSEMLSIADALGVKPDKLNDAQIGAALKLVLEKVDKIPELTNVLGTSKTLAASQFLVNEVNKLALLGKEKADLVGIQANNNNKSIKEIFSAGFSSKTPPYISEDERFLKKTGIRSGTNTTWLPNALRYGTIFESQRNTASFQLGIGHQARLFACTSEEDWVEFFSTFNTFPDKNGFLKNVNNNVDALTTADLDSLIQVPVDQIFYFDSATPPTGYIARNGQAIDKVKMPKLFARYGANMPDDRDRVHRMTGTLAGAVGATQEDAIRNIVGTFYTREELIAGADGVFSIPSNPWTGNTQRNRGDGTNPIFRFDASTVVPTASENRVKSRIILACNKIQ